MPKLESSIESNRKARNPCGESTKSKKSAHTQRRRKPHRKDDSSVNVSREEIKRLVVDCKEKGLNSDETGVVLKKWKRTEYRRLKRQKDRERKKVCFNCRKPGHQLADCPGVLGTREFAVGVCFKCGSTEHTVGQCRLKIKSFPYAKCFVCGETGHLSRNCEENPNGAFPEGGSCKQCGGLDHLKKDCPTLAADNGDKKGKNQVVLRSSGHMASADDDSFAYLEEESAVSTSRKRQPKVVLF